MCPRKSRRSEPAGAETSPGRGIIPLVGVRRVRDSRGQSRALKGLLDAAMSPAEEADPVQLAQEALHALGRERAHGILQEEVATLPDVRADAVRDSLERIRSRFYERPDVLEEIARRLLVQHEPPSC